MSNPMGTCYDGYCNCGYCDIEYDRCEDECLEGPRGYPGPKGEPGSSGEPFEINEIIYDFEDDGNNNT